MGCFEKEAIARINGYFDITVPMYSDSQFRRHFRMSRETVEILTRMNVNCRYHLHKKNSLEMLTYLKMLLKNQKDKSSPEFWYGYGIFSKAPNLNVNLPEQNLM